LNTNIAMSLDRADELLGDLNAYSDEVGRVFRPEVGHRTDVKRATCTDPKRAILGTPAWVV